MMNRSTVAGHRLVLGLTFCAGAALGVLLSTVAHNAKVVAKDAAAKEAPSLAVLPDPKSSDTPMPDRVAGDPDLSATWEVLDDICDPILETSYSGEPQVACGTAAFLPAYAGVGFCELSKLGIHSDYRLDLLGSGEDQAYLVYDGCEPTAGNEGGSLLAVQTERGWEVREHHRADNPDECVPFERSDGRDSLACVRREGKQGVAFDLLSVVELEQWDNPPVELFDDIMAGCDAPIYEESDPSPSEDRVYGFEATWRRFEGYESRREADGVHLIVKLSYALVPVTSSAKDLTCRLVYPDRPESWAYSYLGDAEEIEDKVELEHIQLDYLDDGHRLLPTEATLSILERIRPDGRGRLGLVEEEA